jgi:DNA repair protein RadC
MSQSSISFDDAFSSHALLVRDVDGQYRRASADEVLHLAKRLLAQRVRRGATMSSPQAVKDYLRLQIGVLEHEVFTVIFLDAKHRLLALKEMFRGTVTQTSVYPREVVKEALGLNAVAVILAHSVARHRMRLMYPESLCARTLPRPATQGRSARGATSMRKVNQAGERPEPAEPLRDRQRTTAGCFSKVDCCSVRSRLSSRRLVEFDDLGQLSYTD